MKEAWEIGYSRDSDHVEENDSEDLPQEQVMSVRQTSPTFSEGELGVEEQLDVESSSALRPTLQAMLWLSELVAGTTLKGEAVHKSGPRHNPKESTLTLQDVAALCESIPEDGGLQHVFNCSSQDHQVGDYLGCADGCTVSCRGDPYSTVGKKSLVKECKSTGRGCSDGRSHRNYPVKKIWRWLPNMYWVKRLSLRENNKI